MFRRQLNSKIGNLLALLATRIPNLSMTKALKLLYLIDETAYIRSGAPITWLDYKVWEMGPVAEELYDELRYNKQVIQNGEKLSLEDFITTEQKEGKDGKPQIFINAIAKPNLSEFSDFETTLVNNIIDRFGSYTAKQLINELHHNDSLWHKYVSDHQLDLNFKLYGSKSNHNIDFSKLITNDPVKQMAAQSAYESMKWQEEIDTL